MASERASDLKGIAKPDGSGRLEALLSDLQGMVYRCSPNPPWIPDYISNGSLALTGYSPAELTSGQFAWASITHPDDLGRISADIDACVDAGEPFSVSYRVVHRSGEIRWVLERGHALYEDGRAIALEGFITDISEQKRVEQELRRSEQRLLLAQEAGGIGTFEGDVAERMLSGSAVFFGLYGRPHDQGEMTYDEWIDHLHPEDRDIYRSKLEGALATSDTFVSEYRIRRTDGEARWLLSHFKIERGEDGAPVRVVGVQQDITSRKRGELMWKALLRSIPDGLVVSDEHGTITSFSATAEKLFGYSASEIVGQNLRVLMPAAHAKRHDSSLERYRTTGERRALGKTSRLSPQRKDGSLFPAEIAIAEARFEDKRTFFGFVRDISDRQASEQRLRTLQAEFAHVSRLSAMGQLASSLAHELNQPLAAIANYAAGSLMMLEGTSDKRLGALAEALQGASEQALRAGDIIRALRDFVSGNAGNRTSLPLRQLIDDAAMLALIGDAGRGVFLTVCGVERIAVHVDRIQMQQVLFNLIRNSVEAMTEVAHKEIGISAHRLPGNMVRIDVRDSGCGLSRDVQPFELFNTTKPEGMGVGLALCRSIIEAHGGRIWAEPRQPGSVFSFTLLTTTDEPQPT